MRRDAPGRAAALPAVVALLALGGAAATCRADGLPLADGSVVPPHAAAGGDLSDREAARRRLELLRSPFTQVSERRAVLGGEAVAGFENAVPGETRDAALRALERTVRDVLDRDGWTRPFSAASPLTLLLVHPRPAVPVLVAWDGREKGRLARPVVAVGTAGRSAESVAFDVARAVCLLAVRQAAPDESPWAVEGLAEFLAEEALGLTAAPKPGVSPFLAAQGSLASPPAAALFLREAARLAPAGREGVRAAWEEAGAQRGDDAEAFFRAVARSAGDDGAAGLLASLVAGAVGDAAGSAGAPTGRPFAPGDAALASPQPLGWSRLTFDRLEERGGIEVFLPEGCPVRGGRAILVYRPLSGESDAIPLLPGASRVLPLSGTGALSLVLVDGTEAGDLPVGIRRVAGYPAVVASSSAEWSEGAVNLGWRTSSHQDLLAWVVTRYREDADGGLALEGREIVPTTDSSEEGSGFLVVDREARPGERYRYRVAALTRDGFLSEAFEAAVQTE